VPAASGGLEPPEERAEVDRAFSGAEVHLVLPGVVGQPHLADPLDPEGVEEPVDARGRQVGVVDREGPAEAGRRDLLEGRPALLDRVGEIVDLRARGLGVEVLQEQRQDLSLVGRTFWRADGKPTRNEKQDTPSSHSKVLWERPHNPAA